MLEDCILNGRLRDLEIRTRVKWIEEVNEVENDGMAENTNWRALLRLLSDPYLERKVLMAGPAWSDVEIWDPWNLDMREPFRHVDWIFDLGKRVWRKIPQEERDSMGGT